MDPDDRDELEAVGAAYSVDSLLDVRLRTRDAVNEIARRIHPGMTEEEAQQAASEALHEAGLRKGWHKILIRCGRNTVLNFMDPSEPVVVASNDIFFIDIGPIYGDIEGDAGDTFVLGDDPEMAAAAGAVRDLWRSVRDHWRDTGSSGTELYEFADRTARDMGWQLNLQLTGHRLGEFPHKAHYDGTLSRVGFRPSDSLWVLEIQIRHPTRDIGAFFEDLLLTDDEEQQLVFSGTSRGT